MHSPVFLLPLERLDLLEGVGVDVLHLLLLLGLPAGHAVAAGAARPRRAVPGPGRHAAMGATPGQRLSQCKKKYPSSFSTYFTSVVHTNDDPFCQNLKLWGNFDFFIFLF